jgi:DNA polymerase III alpha subunit
VKTAGFAILKQRPSTAKGTVFMPVSDDRHLNVIVSKEFFERNRSAISNAKFISVEGPLQNEDDTSTIDSMDSDGLANVEWDKEVEHSVRIAKIVFSHLTSRSRPLPIERRRLVHCDR